MASSSDIRPSLMIKERGWTNGTLDHQLEEEDPLYQWIQESKRHILSREYAEDSWLNRRCTTLMYGQFIDGKVTRWKPSQFNPEETILQDSVYFAKVIRQCDSIVPGRGKFGAFASLHIGPNPGLEMHRDLAQPPFTKKTCDVVRTIFDAAIYREYSSTESTSGAVSLFAPLHNNSFTSSKSYSERITPPSTVQPEPLVSQSLQPGEFLAWNDEILAHRVEPLSADNVRGQLILRLFQEKSLYD